MRLLFYAAWEPIYHGRNEIFVVFCGFCVTLLVAYFVLQLMRDGRFERAVLKKREGLLKLTTASAIAKMNVIHASEGR